IVEKKMDLTVNPLPTWQVMQVTPAESCELADGSIEIRATTNIDRLIVEETEQVFSLVENEVLRITDLAAGSYAITAINNGCQSTRIIVVDNNNPPLETEYTITGIAESCSADGINPGVIEIEFV